MMTPHDPDPTFRLRRYDKGLRAQLKADWREQRQRLKNAVATNVMGLALYDRRLRHPRPRAGGEPAKPKD